MSPFVAGLLADLVMLVHLGFVLFVVAGALLVLRHPRLAWVHVPSALYGATIEIVGWVCPLTPLEQALRRAAGSVSYSGGFIEHYVGGLLYPADWDRLRIWLGIAVLALNAAAYARLLLRRSTH